MSRTRLQTAEIMVHQFDAWSKEYRSKAKTARSDAEEFELINASDVLRSKSSSLSTAINAARTHGASLDQQRLINFAIESAVGLMKAGEISKGLIKQAQ